MQERVLIVEDERHARTGLTELVASWGYEAECAGDGVEALELIASWKPSIVVTDLKMPRMNGMELLRKIQEQHETASAGIGGARRIFAVMLTAQGSIESAVEAMRVGAWDYLPKPVEPARLKAILQSASRQQQAESQRLAQEHDRPSAATGDGTLGQMIGSTPQMRAVFALVERVASSNVSVLVTGESGTGKELVARALHDLSSRRGKPFVAVNCAAIPETLIESEIFGHERGAFTGAQERRAGCFELAEEGTLLLDEIGEMPAATQAKLLRVLEDRKLRRLGSKTETPVDVRVVAATNKDPLAAVASGELRGDLYYRLNVFNIEMPPLRSHIADVGAIAEKMIAEMDRKHGCQITGMTPALLERLEAYNWPGNVRELRNTIERAVVLARSGRLGVEHLPQNFGERPPLRERSSDDGGIHLDVGTTVDEGEKQLILKTLGATHNNKTRAAEILGISTKTLQNKLKEYRAGQDD